MKDTVTITTICPMCRKDADAEVNFYDYVAYTTTPGALVSKCFPYLPAGERERLISGICPSCWDALFPAEEDEDEDEGEDYEDDADETGFNPYMGCYDYDC